MTVLERIHDPNQPPALADGAWGTQFILRGLAHGAPPEEWNISKPDAVAAIARDYADAGSEIILTNSFGASEFQLQRHGLADKVHEINRLAARLSREGAGDAVVVAGDIGPSGKMILLGDVTEEQLIEGFAAQARGLLDGGADWIVVETMSDLTEMLCAIRAVRRESTVPVVASMTYEPGEQGYRTIMGNAPEDCVRACIDAGATIVGANCGNGVDRYVPLARQLVDVSPVPVWIKANAGLPTMEGDRVVYTMGPETYAGYVPDLVSSGVRVVGGCCGTGPDYIRAIRRALTA
jgi:5-methyltetrahydrofolate--homocysteine methyltransferase